MPEESGGSRAPISNNEGGVGSAIRQADHARGRNRPSRNRGANANRTGKKFEGKCDGLKGHVFDVTGIHTNNDLFITTTEAIGEYVATTFDGAADYRRGLPDLTLSKLVPPDDPPDDANAIVVEKWKLALRTHHDREKKREALDGRVFALILGQCSRTVRDRIKSYGRYDDVSDRNDVIQLLTMIRQSLYSGATTRKNVHSLINAENDLHKFKQSEGMSNSDYHEKLKGLIEIYEFHGGEPGCSAARIELFLNAADPDYPTQQELDEAKVAARDSYMGTLLLMKSDPRRYGSLVADLENDFTRGLDGYPTTMSKALDMLVNYRTAQHGRPHHQESGISFFVDGEDDGGRGGRGGRTGRGGGRGRGRGRGGRSEDTSATHLTAVGDNLEDESSDYSFTTRSRQSLPKNWLLLDSCSTSNLIANSKILSDIEDSEPMSVHCNAGTASVNKKATLGTYPSRVWHNPSGVANILSMHDASKHYRLTMDTAVENCILMHRDDGKVIKFTPSRNGLYKHDLEEEEGWTMISTVAEQAKKYTRRGYRKAKEARKMQNIVMRPGSRQLMDVAVRHLRNCPVTKADVQAADDIFGPNVGSLKGKTADTTTPNVRGGVASVPNEIMRLHRDVTLEIDIMYINNIPFLVTTSQNIHFGTIEALADRTVTTLRDRLRAVQRLYVHRGFTVSSILADGEFEPLRPWFPMLNCCAENEHVPGVERYIRTIKDRVRSTYRMLPYRVVPRIVIIRLAGNAVLWLNAFPHADGVSEEHSPRYILLGNELTFDRHVRLEFGAYVQTHESHDNSMNQRTMGAICLGPTGNQQGSHWFMNLATGAKVTRRAWTELPMPTYVRDRVDELGRQQNMRATLTFGDRHANEIPDTLDDLLEEDEHPDDSSYERGEESDEDESMGSLDSETDDDDHDDDEAPIEDADFPQDLGSIGAADDDVDSHDSNDASDADDDDSHDPSDASDGGSDPASIDENASHVDRGDTTHDDDDDDDDTTATLEPAENTGVGVAGENTGVEANADDVVEGVDGTQHEAVETVYERFQRAVSEGVAAAEHGEDLPKRQNKQKVDPVYEYSNLLFEGVFRDMEPEGVFAFMMDADSEEMLSFVTAQMSAKKGLKYFGQDGAEAIMKELEQLVYRKVMEGRDAKSLTTQQKKAALKYLMFLKEKRCGRIKGRGCADGRKQRLYKSKDETSSPTITLESLMLTSLIDAIEDRHVITCDIPGAFMQTDLDELIHIKLEGELADLLIRVDPTYRQYLTYEGKTKVIYAELSKALYGTMQASLLFWKDLTKFLVEECGFTVNPYDWCVVNKTVNGKQITIGWYVDDLKLSHVELKVVEDMLEKLQTRFGKEAPLTVTRGQVHEYIGMTIEHSTKGEVKFTMLKFIDELIAECPQELMKGVCTTPAANHLFAVNGSAEKLSTDKAVMFHHLVAKLLYLCQRTRPDIQTAVSFLTTRVKGPDVDDWKKLGRCLRYLKDTRDLPLVLKADALTVINWFVDASFGVHPDCKSHTGAAMFIGKGALYTKSSKQKINTRSSTEAELVGVNDAMTMILWTRRFLEAQGFTVRDNIIHQDNQSTMLLAKHGRQSSGKTTRHLDVRYYFVTDNVKQKQVSIAYCPTQDMVADFFTKPLQGSLFRKFRALILNLPNAQTPPSLGQECVGPSVTLTTISPVSPNISRRTYADAVKNVNGDSRSPNQITKLPSGKDENATRRYRKSTSCTRSKHVQKRRILSTLIDR